MDSVGEEGAELSHLCWDLEGGRGKRESPPQESSLP